MNGKLELRVIWALYEHYMGGSRDGGGGGVAGGRDNQEISQVT